MANPKKARGELKSRTEQLIEFYFQNKISKNSVFDFEPLNYNEYDLEENEDDM